MLAEKKEQLQIHKLAKFTKKVLFEYRFNLLMVAYTNLILNKLLIS